MLTPCFTSASWGCDSEQLPGLLETLPPAAAPSLLEMLPPAAAPLLLETLPPAAAPLLLETLPPAAAPSQWRAAHLVHDHFQVAVCAVM
jgi:hypothetical protein